MRGEICYPEGSTYGQGAMIVVNYLPQHPEIMHNDLGVIAETALKKAWPGKK
jgi:hypothetical protein